MDKDKNIKSKPSLSDEQARELAELKIRYAEHIKKHGSVDLARLYPEPSDKEELLMQLDELKLLLDSFRPLDITEIEKIKSAFDIEYTYDSNAIEGNSLTLSETQLVVMEGLTIGGKPLKDHFEAVDHYHAVSLMRELAGATKDFNEQTLLDLHALVLRNTHRDEAGKYRSQVIAIGGSHHSPPTPGEIPARMQELFKFYEENKKVMQPVELAATMHAKLVYVHPFIDGNGRTARLVMNLILLRSGYPVTIIPSDRLKRDEYYKALETHHIFNEPDDFVQFVGENVKRWLMRYLSLTSSDISKQSNGRGYAFFKKIAPLLENADNT